MIWIILGAAVVLLLVWFVVLYNGVRRAALKVDEAEAGIDAALAKRYDALTKLLDITRGYASHERETLERVVELRGAMTMAEKEEAGARMDETARGLTLMAESYPELKSSENFKTLQLAVMDTEEHLQAARRLYNGNVAAYNERLVTFPSSLAAAFAKAKPRPFFRADAEQRDDVKMRF